MPSLVLLYWYWYVNWPEHHLYFRSKELHFLHPWMEQGLGPSWLEVFGSCTIIQLQMQWRIQTNSMMSLVLCKSENKKEGECGGRESVGDG